MNQGDQMATVRFETNISVPEDRAKIIAQNLTKAVARIAGEPESEVKVEIAGNRNMLMAKSNEPIAHVEINSVDLPKERASELTRAICPVVEEALGIQDSKIYIAVVSRRNSMWRVNGAMSE